MSAFDLWGKSFDCQCGRRHTISTDCFVYGPEAMQKLGETAARYASGPDLLLIADQRTYEAAGAETEEQLKSAGSLVKRYIVPDYEGGQSPQTDDLTKDSIFKNAPEADIFVAVGSGVVNDLTKWTAFERKKPYLALGTAASMNGYSSANVAATIDGLKVLFHAQAPKGVFAVPTIIENAPFELTASGLGDAVAKPVSSADWKLNQFLFNEYYCQFIVDLISGLEPIYFENPEQIARRETGAIKALFEALVLSGVAMTLAGTSAPASGGEHLVSHALDMVAAAQGREHDYHGRQVGVTTILSAALYRKVLAVETPALRKPPADVDQDFWGPLTGVVREAYNKKAPKYEAAIDMLSRPANWDNLRSSLSGSIRSPEKIKDCLERAGGAHRIQDIRSGGRSLEVDQFKKFWKNAFQMRERFTILDLALIAGLMPGAMEEIISETGV